MLHSKTNLKLWLWGYQVRKQHNVANPCGLKSRKEAHRSSTVQIHFILQSIVAPVMTILSFPVRRSAILLARKHEHSTSQWPDIINCTKPVLADPSIEAVSNWAPSWENWTLKTSMDNEKKLHQIMHQVKPIHQPVVHIWFDGNPSYVSYAHQNLLNGPQTGVAFYCFLNITACMLSMEMLRFPMTHL